MCFLYFVIATIDYTTFRLVKTHPLLCNPNLFLTFVGVVFVIYHLLIVREYFSINSKKYSYGHKEINY